MSSRSRAGLLPISCSTSSRRRLYLVNNNTGRVDVFDYNRKVIAGNIAVGTRPVAGRDVHGWHWLYVTSGATPTQTAAAPRS